VTLSGLAKLADAISDSVAIVHPVWSKNSNATKRAAASAVIPDTILRWHRELIARKWDYSDRVQKPVGRSPVTADVRDLVLQIAKENPTWGYDRIQGALANLGHQLSDQTVGNILKAHGIEPAPERKRQSSWKTFLKSHWDVLGAIDFTTVEVWTKSGLVTYYVLFVMKVATRRVHFAGCTPNPTEAWMAQMARNLTDCTDGFATGLRYLLMDRDSVQAWGQKTQPNQNLRRYQGLRGDGNRGFGRVAEPGRRHFRRRNRAWLDC
jgi:hypothetical protein